MPCSCHIGVIWNGERVDPSGKGGSSALSVLRQEGNEDGKGPRTTREQRQGRAVGGEALPFLFLVQEKISDARNGHRKLLEREALSVGVDRAARTAARGPGQCATASDYRR